MEQTISLSQAAIEFGLPRTTIAEWIETGKVSSRESKGLIHVDRSELIRQMKHYAPHWTSRRELVVEDITAFGKETMTRNEVSLLTGIERKALSRYLKSGALVAKQETTGRRQWLINAWDLINFILHHTGQ